MCGIFGFFGLEDNGLLKKMCKILNHRGPDEQGFFLDKNIGLGNCRLSIIDLKKGKQPIHNENENIWVTFNGEIYNYKRLRENLEQKGHKFYTNSDTEVIIHAYEEYGEDCVQKFEGMFAFAIWDSNKKQLFLARDRLGIKSLYYTMVDKKFLFASEIKALLLYEELKRELNLNSLNKYLSFRYVPGEETFFKRIKKLLPGHILILKNGNINIKQFWSLQEDKAISHGELLSLLEGSVKKRLMSEVPVGLYLSGGLDSSAILSLTPQDRKIKTFCVGFEGADKINELKDAYKIAENFGTEHYETLVTKVDYKLLPSLAWYLDQPVGDPVIIPNFKLSELAKKHVKVVLCGEGADEIFGGYVHYRNSYYYERYGKYLRPLKGIIKYIPLTILDKYFQYPASLGKKGKQRVFKIFDTLNNPSSNYLNQVSIFDEDDKNCLFLNGIKQELKQEAMIKDIKPYFCDEQFLKNIMTYEIKNWLPDYILSKLDMLCMANSIEGRVPYLDHRLVEKVYNLPIRIKLKKNIPKHLLRNLLIKKLPKSVLKKKKKPFFMPLDSELGKEIRDLFSNTISKTIKEPYFQYDYLKNLLKNRDKSKFIYDKQIFALLMFKLWYQSYIESDNFKYKDKLKLL